MLVGDGSVSGLVELDKIMATSRNEIKPEQVLALLVELLSQETNPENIERLTEITNNLASEMQEIANSLKDAEEKKEELLEQFRE